MSVSLVVAFKLPISMPLSPFLSLSPLFPLFPPFLFFFVSYYPGGSSPTVLAFLHAGAHARHEQDAHILARGERSLDAVSGVLPADGGDDDGLFWRVSRTIALSLSLVVAWQV